VSPSPEPPDLRLPAWDAVPNAADDPGAGRPPVPEGTYGLRVRSVSEVTRTIRELVRSDDGLREVWVEGEVGRVTVSTAGHAYFTLKDARSQLQCVWFRDDRLRSPFQPQTGLQVVAHGRIDLFEPQGALQLYVDALQPSGFGDLAIRFEQLKARLSAEGLFESARKRALPARPPVVAVVTSPSGAVWRDVCNVLGRRWPLVRVVLVGCQVQGDGAPASIVAALGRLDRWREELEAADRAGEAPSATIVARGGGSLEDLWAFNDERVVRAIAAHGAPVVSGVGHETDVTLTDFVADVRAPTPSAAAELVVPDRAEMTGTVDDLGRRAAAAVGGRLQAARRETVAERRALDRLEPRAQLAVSRERAGLLLERAARVMRDRMREARAGEDRLAARLGPLLAARLDAARAGLAATMASLTALAPEATLRRGYSIARRADDGRILRDPAEAPTGATLEIALWRGTLAATSDGARPTSSDRDVGIIGAGLRGSRSAPPTRPEQPAKEDRA
jgi:exodeoxyribonuclease VII large subunit